MSQQPLDTDTPVTGMTDVTVVGDVSRVMCGGPHVSSQNKSAPCFVHTRNKLFNSIFPEVLRSRQVHIQSGNNAKCTSTDPSQYPYMPPLCQIDEILQYIETNHIDTADIELYYGSYSVKTIKLFKTFYTGKNIQDKVRMEIKWAEQQNYLMIDGVSQLDQSCLDEYLQIVLNYAENDTVSIANNRYYIEDLIFLFGERWLSNSLLMQLSVMLNATFHETKTWVYYASDLQHHTDFDTQMCQQFANIHDGQIILFVPVGSNGGTCFMGSLQVSNTNGTNILLQSNHFALAVYSIEFNIVTYADTLGWGMPETVKTIFQKISQGLGKPAPLYNFCHQPGADTGLHTCSHLHSLKYPLQTCSSICGVSNRCLTSKFISDRFLWSCCSKFPN